MLELQVLCLVSACVAVGVLGDELVRMILDWRNKG